MSLSLLYQLPQYLVFWLLSCEYFVWWNPIEFWNFHFQLHFLVHGHTKSWPYWIIVSDKTANAHTFLHYHVSVCTPFRRICHIDSLYEIVSSIVLQILQTGDLAVLSILCLIVLHIYNKLSMHCFCSTFFSFFFLFSSFLEFFRINCFSFLVCYSSTCSDCN